MTPSTELEHGELTTYTNHRCRCPACTKRWNAYSRARREGDLERHRALDRARYERRPAVSIARAHARRVAAAGTLDHGCVTPDVLEAIVATRECAYCGMRGPVTADHVVPLARGGVHCRLNLAPACSACNRRKGDRDLAEFLAENPHRC